MPLTALLVGIGIALAVLNIRAVALPVVKASILAWVWLYTLGLPAPIRDRRRGEIRSHLWEQHRDQKDAGYTPDLIAIQMVSSCWVSQATCLGASTASRHRRSYPMLSTLPHERATNTRSTGLRAHITITSQGFLRTFTERFATRIRLLILSLTRSSSFSSRGIFTTRPTRLRGALHYSELLGHASNALLPVGRSAWRIRRRRILSLLTSKTLLALRG